MRACARARVCVRVCSICVHVRVRGMCVRFVRSRSCTGGEEDGEDEQEQDVTEPKGKGKRMEGRREQHTASSCCCNSPQFARANGFGSTSLATVPCSHDHFWVDEHAGTKTCTFTLALFADNHYRTLPLACSIFGISVLVSWPWLLEQSRAGSR